MKASNTTIFAQMAKTLTTKTTNDTPTIPKILLRNANTEFVVFADGVTFLATERTAE